MLPGAAILKFEVWVKDGLSTFRFTNPTIEGVQFEFANWKLVKHNFPLQMEHNITVFSLKETIKPFYRLSDADFNCSIILEAKINPY